MSADPRDIDPRLLDAVAMCLCWAEYGPEGLRNRPVGETPQSYWAAMDSAAKARYHRDAAVIASAMMSDRAFAVVPTEATEAMLAVITPAQRTWCSRLWHNMIAKAREEMRWRRSPDQAVGGSPSPPAPTG